MNQIKKQTVGIFGSGPLANAVAKQIFGPCTVVAFDPQNSDTEYASGVECLSSLAELSLRTNLVLSTHVESSKGGTGLLDLAAALDRGATIIDLVPGDPLAVQVLTKQLSEYGVSLVDAPIHTESTARFPEESVLLCGGPPIVVATARPLLDRLCPKVVVCGESGSGYAAHAVVAALAICNRLVAYECVAMGMQSGLALADMTEVLNRSSGASSATERVLPSMLSGERTSDANLTEIAAQLSIGTELARHVGAPMLIANQALQQVIGASRVLGADATLDDLRRLVEVASDFHFNP